MRAIDYQKRMKSEEPLLEFDFSGNMTMPS